MLDLNIKPSDRPLATYERDVYSQFGQDGVLEYVLSKYKPLSHLVCFEVGGWDGIHYSNTCNLAVNHSSRVCFAEADPRKYKALLHNHSNLIASGRVFATNAYVDNSTNSVASILSRHGLDELDFISIDVDGLDYYLFERLNVDPAFVLIEFNHSIHLDVSYVQPDDPSVSVGSSARSIYQLASEKGYSLIHSFHTDLLFVKTSLAIELDLAILPISAVALTGAIYAWTGYDGSLHAITNLRGIQEGIICPWVGKLTKNKDSLQPLPSFLIFFPDSASASLAKFFGRLRLLVRKVYLLFFIN